MAYKVLTCIVCGYVYNEELGDEEHGLAPGTRFGKMCQRIGNAQTVVPVRMILK